MGTCEDSIELVCRMSEMVVEPLLSLDICSKVESVNCPVSQSELKEPGYMLDHLDGEDGDEVDPGSIPVSHNICEVVNDLNYHGEIENVASIGLGLSRICVNETQSKQVGSSHEGGVMPLASAFTAGGEIFSIQSPVKGVSNGTFVRAAYDVSSKSSTIPNENINVVPNLSSLSLPSRRSSRGIKSFQKVKEKTPATKCTKKASKSTRGEAIDFPLNAIRKKRSFMRKLSKPLCPSGWGSSANLSKHFELSSETDINAASSKGLVKEKLSGKSGEKKSSKVDVISKPAEGEKQLVNRPIRLKVTFGKKDNENNAKATPLGIDTSCNFSLSNDIHHPDFCSYIETTDETVMNNSSRKEIALVKRCNASETDLGKSTNTISAPLDRYVDPGTSPDSEVFDQNLDATTRVSASTVTLKPVNNTSIGASGPINGSHQLSDKKSKKKRNKKDKEKVLKKSEKQKVKNVTCGDDVGIITPSENPSSNTCGSELISSEGPHNGLDNGADSNIYSDPSGKLKVEKNWLGNCVMNVDGISCEAYNEIHHSETGKFVTFDVGKTDMGNNSCHTVLSNGVADVMLPPRIAWVCCDDCNKWRCIPAELADVIEATNSEWTCKDNQDEAFADCSIPQEKSNSDINAELQMSDTEESRYNYLGSKGLPSSTWMRINSNLYLHRSRKTQTVDEIMVCHCKRPTKGGMGCGSRCLNRMLNIECVQGTCPCGDRCSNQRFQRRRYAKLSWFRCGKKGYGLQVLEDILKGQFLIEYVGEVLDLQAYESRLKEYASQGHKHFYFMTLNGNEVIDACVKGNLGRFVNHSCDPNCRTEKWVVNGEICVGLFALRNIRKGEELTFDYNYVRVFGAAAKKCHCGSKKCRGYIGGDPRNAEIIIHCDSDDEFPEPIAIDENGQIDHNIVTMMDRMNSGDNELGQSAHNLCEPHVKGMLEGGDTSNKMEKSLISTPTTSLEQNVLLMKRTVKDSLPRLVDSSGEMCEGDNVECERPSKPRPRMKISCPCKSLKHRTPGSNSASCNFEAVEKKLNELLDSDGGICKRKDAFKGYLKLLLLTAASGDRCHGGAIQSNRDLSMILDAILKTKSRRILRDIINNNGLQMLHNMMKLYRKDFNKIPILRKLLKVFEFLAEKVILSVECINRDPIHPGVESFQESILSFTEHNDRKVHQIARNFRHRWIRKPMRKVNRRVNTGQNRVLDRGEDHSTSFETHRHHWRDHDARPPTEPMSYNPQTVLSQNSTTTTLQEVSCPNICDTQPPRRKRKSRWDQPACPLSPKQNKEQRILPNSPHIITNPKSEVSGGSEICVQVDDVDKTEDVPPRCSRSPSHCGTHIKSAYVACIGLFQEKFDSHSPVAYGMPFSVIQELGTLHSESDDIWVIAPAMPFQPFPPLPPYPRTTRDLSQPCTVNGVTVNGVLDRNFPQPCTVNSVTLNVGPGSEHDFPQPCNGNNVTFNGGYEREFPKPCNGNNGTFSGGYEREFPQPCNGSNVTFNGGYEREFPQPCNGSNVTFNGGSERQLCSGNDVTLDGGPYWDSQHNNVTFDRGLEETKMDNRFHENSYWDQGVPSTSSTSNMHMLPQERGLSNDVGRRFDRHRNDHHPGKRNNQHLKSRVPWARKRYRQGFKGNHPINGGFMDAISNEPNNHRCSDVNHSVDRAGNSC